MELKIDDKLFVHELVRYYVECAYDECKRITDDKLWYGDFATMVENEIHKLVEDNKEALLERIAEKSAELIRKDVSLRAVLGLLANKE